MGSGSVDRSTSLLLHQNRDLTSVDPDNRLIAWSLVKLLSHSHGLVAFLRFLFLACLPALLLASITTLRLHILYQSTNTTNYAKPSPYHHYLGTSVVIILPLDRLETDLLDCLEQIRLRQKRQESIHTFFIHFILPIFHISSLIAKCI